MDGIDIMLSQVHRTVKKIKIHSTTAENEKKFITKPVTRFQPQFFAYKSRWIDVRTPRTYKSSCYRVQLGDTGPQGGNS